MDKNLSRNTTFIFILSSKTAETWKWTQPNWQCCSDKPTLSFTSTSKNEEENENKTQVKF